MEILGKASLYIHIFAGLITLTAGPIAIFYNFKNIKNHRKAGQVFFYAMMVVCTSAVLGFLKHPSAPFSQFLLGLAVLVFASMFRGVRAIQLMKGGQVNRYDWAYIWMLAVGGFVMVSYGSYLTTQTESAVGILLLVFGTLSLLDTRKNFRMFGKPNIITALDWYKLHIGSMMGGFTASTTAFLVNANIDLPWYLLWFGPTVILVPMQIYFNRKIEPKKKGSDLA